VFTQRMRTTKGTISRRECDDFVESLVARSIGFSSMRAIRRDALKVPQLVIGARFNQKERKEWQDIILSAYLSYIIYNVKYATMFLTCMYLFVT